MDSIFSMFAGAVPTLKPMGVIVFNIAEATSKPIPFPWKIGLGSLNHSRTSGTPYTVAYTILVVPNTVLFGIGNSIKITASEVSSQSGSSITASFWLFNY